MKTFGLSLLIMVSIFNNGNAWNNSFQHENKLNKREVKNSFHLRLDFYVSFESYMMHKHMRPNLENIDLISYIQAYYYSVIKSVILTFFIKSSRIFL